MASPITIKWNSRPPVGANYQTHKFSICDAIAIAGKRLWELRQDRQPMKDILIAGETAWAILSTLPMTNVDPHRRKDPEKWGHDREHLGIASFLEVFYDGRPEFSHTIRRQGPAPEEFVDIQITDIGPQPWEAATRSLSLTQIQEGLNGVGQIAGETVSLNDIPVMVRKSNGELFAIHGLSLDKRLNKTNNSVSTAIVLHVQPSGEVD